jgi:Mn-dependent DtxR family transcriptional regulator
MLPGNLSRRIVREVYAYTAGRPMRWAPVQTIARRLSLSDEAMTGQAIELARRKGWLDYAGGHSICLTEEGRRMAR